MSELREWWSLLRRAWSVLRLRTAPLAQSCHECGVPLIAGEIIGDREPPEERTCVDCFAALNAERFKREFRERQASVARQASDVSLGDAASIAQQIIASRRAAATWAGVSGQARLAQGEAEVARAHVLMDMHTSVNPFMHGIGSPIELRSKERPPAFVWWDDHSDHS